MSDVESRLRELRRATEHQVRPSPDLLRRIESSLEPRAGRRWPQAVALAAAVAVVVVAVASMRVGRDDQQRVLTRPPTRGEYVEAMNQRCQEYVREVDEVQVLFPTPEAYVLAAENRITALDRSLERMRFVGAPPDGSDLLQQVTSGAAVARASAQRALAAAQAGDAVAAGAALAESDASVDQVGNLLADYGADLCRPRRTP